MIIRYLLVHTERSAQDLEAKIQWFLDQKEGWEPIGGPLAVSDSGEYHVPHTYLAQAMVQRAVSTQTEV